MPTKNDIQNKTASIYIDDQPAIEALERLTPKAEAFNKKIEAGTKKAEALSKSIKKAFDAGKSTETLQKQLNSVNASLEKNRQGLAKVTAQQNQLQQQIANKTGPSLRQQEAMVKRLTNEYYNLSVGTKEAEQKLEELGRASRVLDQMRDRLNSVRNAQKGSGGGIFSGAFWGSLAGNLVSKASDVVHEFFSGMIDEALQAEETSARLRGTLDNLGRADAFDRLTRKADEMAKKFTYIDNDEIVGVFNQLIDYGKLTEEQMDQLLPIIIDFAAKQRISLAESSSVIVKALEGNGKALKEYGISIKDGATESERMAIVMGTLKEKVDGAGEAFMNTTAGGLASMRTEFNNLKEDLGTKLLPVLNKALTFINNEVEGIQIMFDRANDIINLKPFGSTQQERLMKEEKEYQDAKMVEILTNKKIAEYQKAIDNKVISPLTKQIITRDAVIANLQKQLANPNKSDQEKAVLSGVLSHFSNKPLGLGGASADGKDEAAAKKAAEQAKKIAEDRKKLYEQLAKLDRDYHITFKSEFAIELEEAMEKYEALKELAHGNKEDLKKIEESYFMAVHRIRQKYTALEMDETQKVEDARKKIHLEADESIRRLEERLGNKPNGVIVDGEMQQREIAAKKELDLLKAKGFKKLDLQKKQLEEQEQAELQSREHTESEIAVIEEKYRQQKMELEMQFYSELFSQILNIGQQIQEITAIDNKAEEERDNRQLEQRQKSNDKEKQAYKRMLDSKVITQQQYNAKVKALDDELAAQTAAAKRKQWQKQQKADLIAAGISGAQAILAALQTKPFFPLGLIMAGIATVKTVKQINAIKNAPVPEFGSGGALNGPSHGQGGMPVINPRTGRKEAEVEGGEVILSRKTVQNNPGIVGALLHSSMHQGGRTIAPWFRSRPYQTFDFSGINRTIGRVRHFANGGTFDTAISSSGSGDAPVLPEGFEQLPALMAVLAERLNTPPRAYVVLSDYQAASDKLDQIKGDATFVRQ